MAQPPTAPPPVPLDAAHAAIVAREAGLLALLAVLVSTWRVPGLRITLQAGLPWLAIISLCYFGWRRWGLRKPDAGVATDG